MIKEKKMSVLTQGEISFLEQEHIRKILRKLNWVVVKIKGGIRFEIKKEN